MWNLQPGETTDDTALTKAVLEGYQEGSLNLNRVRDVVLCWQDSDPKDTGNQTSKVLGELRSHSEALSLPNDPNAQGNGAVMRDAPQGIMTWSSKRAGNNAWVEAAIIHPSWVARASSTLVASLVAYLIDGKRPRKALEAQWFLLENRDEPDKKGREVLRPLERYERDPGGIIYTIRLAPRGVLDAGNFRSGVERVVWLAGDADTNGAVAGMLLGLSLARRRSPREPRRYAYSVDTFSESYSTSTRAAVVSYRRTKDSVLQGL